MCVRSGLSLADYSTYLTLRQTISSQEHFQNRQTPSGSRQLASGSICHLDILQTNRSSSTTITTTTSVILVLGVISTLVRGISVPARSSVPTVREHDFSVMVHDCESWYRCALMEGGTTSATQPKGIPKQPRGVCDLVAFAVRASGSRSLHVF